MGTTTDVLVIGTGAVGASAAYHLARAGLSVLVVDRFVGPAEGSTATCPPGYNACGFSGHGFMQAPEIGRMIAEDVVEGAITIDVTPLRIDRFTVAGEESTVRMMF
jgi:glycine/D-amino acid oxidase-like deaminating enzyme